MSQCPSDTPGTYAVDSPFTYTLPQANYVACQGSDQSIVEKGVPYGTGGGQDTCYMNTANNPGSKRALFNWNVTRRVQDVLDGTSLTVALSEVIQPNKPGQLVRDLRGLWISDLTSVYTHLRSPNSILPDRMLSGYCNPAKAPCQGNSPCWGTLITTARSYHPGGVNVGMADGGVRFISNTVDLLTVWQPLASIDSGEVIDGDTY